MKVLSIIDSFKGTILSSTLGKIITKELKRQKIYAEYLPISDGGDGFLDSLSSFKHLKRNHVKVLNPIGKKIKSYYLYDNALQIAYLEMAKASGLNLLKIKELNPLKTSTHGLGQLILLALEKGAKKIIIGIGGSATNDGGAGMLEVLGAKFYNEKQERIININCEKLGMIKVLDYDLVLPLIKNCEFIILSDVNNPLLGEMGATKVFSKQKGAKESDIKVLESNLAHYANIIEKTIGASYKDKPGAGAAGGVGFAFYAMFNVKYYSGIKYLLELINFKNKIKNFDIIITGEGKIDKQSFYGKVISEVLKQAQSKKKILVCAVNTFSNQELINFNIDYLFKIVDNIATMEESLRRPKYYYKKLSKIIAMGIKELE